MSRRKYVPKRTWDEQKDYDEMYGKNSGEEFTSRYTSGPNGWKLTSYGCTKRYDGGNVWRDNELNEEG